MKNQGEALATLDKLAAHLGGRIESGTQGGHPVKTVNLGQFAIHYGTVDGKVVITSGTNGRRYRPWKATMRGLPTAFQPV